MHVDCVDTGTVLYYFQFVLDGFEYTNIHCIQFGYRSASVHTPIRKYAYTAQNKGFHEGSEF